MKIDSQIHFSSGLDFSKAKELLKECTYSNPEFFQKMNMGFSVYGIPKEVKTYEANSGKLSVMRGELPKVLKHFPSEKVTYDHKSYPISLVYKNSDFALDTHQTEAIKATQKNSQGVIHAVTSAGKTHIVIKSICETGQRALIVVHRKILLEQFKDDISKYVFTASGQPYAPGIIGAGKFAPDFEGITIAIDKSLGKHLKELKDKFGMVFLDECHLAPADTMYSIINNMNSKYRFGLSGTLKRKDQKDYLIYATFGPVISKITKDQLLALNRVVPVEVKVYSAGTEFDWNEAAEEYGPIKARKMLEDKIASDVDRNRHVAEFASKQPGKTIVLTRRVEPCYVMQKMLQEQGIESGVITGRNSKEALESYNQMKHSDLPLIFATIGCVSTGVSISDLDNIVLAAPVYNNELLLQQILGRLMRSSPGKTKGTLWFVWDYKIFEEYKLKKVIKILEK